MSIFRKTFHPTISGSLTARQDALVTRTPDQIKYLNERYSYIRMVSSVDVGGKNTIAQNNILQGGVLGWDPITTQNYYLRSGVGYTGFEGYSSKTSAVGVDHKFGIRPIPGITSIDVKSKSAYGSLREVTVNFQCWDIKQLEELEVLYMRPGYTVLVEWGWAPYLDNKGNIIYKVFTDYNILTPPFPSDVSTIAKELYNKSILEGGNYDALFGYVKNYQWSARGDGGYDCQTTIISVGEIIESLKVNYTRPDLVDYKIFDPSSTGDGYLNDEFSPQGITPSSYFSPAYGKNTLAGIWSELYYKLNDTNTKFSTNGIFNTIATPRACNRNDLWKRFDLSFNKSTVNTPGGIAITGKSTFITLDVALEFINQYIVARSSAGRKESLVRFSLDSSTITSDGTPLLCIAHPLQVSVDPSVCLIKSPLWYNTNNPQSIIPPIQSNLGVQQTAAEALRIYGEISAAIASINTDEPRLIKAVTDMVTDTLFGLVEAEFSKNPPKNAKYTSLAAIINGEFENDNLTEVNQIATHLRTLLLTVTYTPTNRLSANGQFVPIFNQDLSITAPQSVSTQAQLITNLPNALGAIKELGDLQLDYFYNNDPNTELANIKNIYVNLDFLYQQAINLNLEASDNNEKDQINLYKYVKSIISAIQTSIGNINNFEIHVDPTDINVARIIDVNYTEPSKPSNLFELQVQNAKSIVRSYTLQSQIFPEQSAIIAIGSQVKGGQLGIQNNTMIDFNTNLTDRIIPAKEFPKKEGLHGSGTNFANIAAALANIIQLFSSFSSAGKTTTTGGSDLDSLYISSKNSLRDIIVYFQSIVDSPSSNRNIIPTKFSFEMDGIGGLVIGNLFKINQDVLPKGYKGSGVGADLAQTVVGISHAISNGDWVTKVDALNIILDRKASKFNTINIVNVVNSALNSLINVPSSTLPGNSPFTGPYPIGNNSANAGTSFTKRAFVRNGGNRSLNDIQYVILHATAGYGDATETANTMYASGYVAHYVVDRGGTKIETASPTLITYHANNANGYGVGIEIANIAWLEPLGNNVWKDEYWPTNKALTPTQRANLNRPKGTGGVTTELAAGGGWKWEGHQYYEEITDIQASALKDLIKSIIKQCPNILDSNGKLNYNFSETNILQTVWQLSVPNSGPVKGANYNSNRVVTGKSFRGIYVHAAAQKSGHGDIQPTPKLVKMLQDLKTELKA
jgi:hypothetical protein